VFYELENRLLNFLSRPPLERSVQFSNGLAIGSLQGPERKENQDRALVAIVSEFGLRPKVIAAVCDGLGGMSEGGRAAEIALSSFIDSIARQHSTLSEEMLRDAINHANRAVYSEVSGNGGATIAAIAYEPGRGTWIVHVGDSRVYSSTSGGQLRLHTKDDTIASLAKTDLPSLEDELDNRLLQFVGSSSQIEPHISKEASFAKRILITTDGAHGLGKNVLEGIERSATSSADWIRKLTYVADATSVRDNATAISISVEEIDYSRLPTHGWSINLWSATEVLEICFSDLHSFADDRVYARPTNLPNNQRVTNKIQPPLRKPTRKQKTSPTRKATGTRHKAKSQLRIDFKDNAD
jgi:PPM family protein phosphatase